MIRQLVSTELTALGDDEVDIRMSTGALGRGGHVLVPQGAELANYRANPIMLWQHDPGSPVGRAEGIRVNSDAIAARVTFAPAGVSPKADEIRGLVKSGIVNAVSVGFEPIDGVPLDPRRPHGGQRFTRWELLECSFVSVPADAGATVTARSAVRSAMPPAIRSIEPLYSGAKFRSWASSSSVLRATSATALTTPAWCAPPPAPAKSTRLRAAFWCSKFLPTN
jgi:HK97 family phage prohead protease